MNFASVTRVQSDLAGAGKIEQAARRLWLQRKGEWYSEAASRIREQIDAVPWVNRVEPRGHVRQV